MSSRNRRTNPRRTGPSVIAVYDPTTFTDTQQAALIAARAGGCTCNPDIEITAGTGDIGQATVRHDNWCALLRKGDVN